MAHCWHKKAYLECYLLSLYVRAIPSNRLISNEDFSADCAAIYGEHCNDIARLTLGGFNYLVRSLYVYTPAGDQGVAFIREEGRPVNFHNKLFVFPT